MDIPATLYPYELLPLLESLHADAFTGRLELTSDDGHTIIYLTDGDARYATTTDVSGSFPAYLITEELFSRDRVHRWLSTCTDEEMSIEDLLLQRGVTDPSGVVQLKEDLSQSVLARSFCITADLAVEPMEREALNFGSFALDPLEALFECASSHPVYGAMLETLQGSWQTPIRRSPAFYTLFTRFRRHFVSTPIALAIERSATLTELTADSPDPEPIIAQVFALYASGMVHFQGEEPRSRLFARGQPEVSRPVTPPPSKRMAARGPSVNVVGRPTTQPGVPRGASSSGDPVGTRPGELPRTRTRVLIAPPPPSQDVSMVEARAQKFADLHGGLVGQGLVDTAERARSQDFYRFLDIPPTAPLSLVRAAWMRCRRRYQDESYHGHFLPGPAGAALRYLQTRTEEAYEALTDLRRRREHDALHAVPGALGDAALDDVFYAEGVFKAAQIRMTREAFAEAAELLQEAIQRNAREPEYISYLAYAVWGAHEVGQKVSRKLGQPDELIERALAVNPQLESAWIFRARIAEAAGDSKQAYAAYFSALKANPDNDEARQALDQYREEGVELELLDRGRLSERIAQMLGRRR